MCLHVGLSWLRFPDHSQRIDRTTQSFNLATRRKHLEEPDDAEEPAANQDQHKKDREFHSPGSKHDSG